MKLTGTLAGIVLTALLASRSYAQQAAQTFTLDGRLYSDTAATTPLAEAGVAVKVQILDQNQTCILYEESQTVDTSTTTGYFTIQVGSPTSGAPAVKRGANDTGNLMAQVYSNMVTNVSGKLVSNSMACTYTPASGDQRFLRVTVTPTAGAPQILSPNIALDSAPSAIVAERAETLQGLLPANILQVNSTAPADLIQAHLENIFSTTNYPRLTSLLSVPPTNYLQTGTNGSVEVPQVGGSPTLGLSAGQFWYDSTANQLKYYNGSAVQTLDVSGGLAKADATHDGYLAQADWTTFNSKQSSTLASANIWVGSGGSVATAQAPSGDVSMTNGGVFTVAGVKGKSVSAAPTLAGQALRYDGTNWTPNFISMTDLRSSTTGTNQFATSCLTNQTLTYNSVGDVMSCQNISLTAGQIPSTGATGFYENGGNSFAASATLGTNDNNSLGFKTNGTVNMTLLTNGNVGIATSSPQAALDVAGQIRSQAYNAGGATSINWNNGNVQYTSAACDGTGNQFSFSNLLEGGTYTLIVTGTATGSCNFTCAGTSCASGTYTTTTPAGVTGWSFMPNNNTPNGSYTVYTMFRAGGVVLVSWISGFGPAN